MFINLVVNTGTCVLCVCVYIYIHVFANGVQVLQIHVRVHGTSLDYTLMSSKVIKLIHTTVELCIPHEIISVKCILSLCRSAEEKYGARSRDVSEVSSYIYSNTCTCIYKHTVEPLYKRNLFQSGAYAYNLTSK